MEMLSDRVIDIKPSPTKEISLKAAELRAQGKEIISLSLGEPDFDTPSFIKTAGIEAIVEGQTKYTPVAGTSELRKAIRRKFLTENGLDFADNEITVGCGAKQVIYNAFQATVNPGDQVLFPAPYWVSYPAMATLAGGLPIVLPGIKENGFKIRPDDLDRAITAKTKWLILNSPSNPSGATYSRLELEKIADVLLQHSHVHIICDDVYEYIIYDGIEFDCLARICPALGPRILTVNALSKSFCMTGWRVGYGAGPASLIKAINTVQSHSSSHTSSISQAAAVEALNGPRTEIAAMVSEFEMRRNFIVEQLNDIPGIECSNPEGAFYAFPSCGHFIGKRTPAGAEIKTDIDFASYLLEHAGIAVVPGAAFGMSPYFRVSFASSISELGAGCKKIRAACEILS